MASDHVSDIGCDGVETPDGDAYFYASLSEDDGTDGAIEVWDGDPSATDLVWMRDDTRPVTMTFSPTHVEATIPLLPSGEAQIVADLEPVEEFSFTDPARTATAATASRSRARPSPRRAR